METNSQDVHQEIPFWNDVVNIDENSAILMDGQYFIPTNARTILFPDDETQYFIQNTGETFFDNNILNENEIIHLVNTTESEQTEDQNQIVYFTNDVVESKVEINNDADILQKVGLTFTEGIVPEMETIKVESEYFDVDSLLDMSKENEIGGNSEMNGFQYIVQLQNFDTDQYVQDCGEYYDHANTTNIVEMEPTKQIDVSKITGKNLITGQTVTLESYLEKVKNSSKELRMQNAEEISRNSKKKNEHAALSNLLNKKLTIGKTINGQKLIGKVIHVGKKDENDGTTVIESVNGEINALDDGCADSSVTYYDAVENLVPNSVIIEDNQNDNILENIDEMLITDKTAQQDSLNELEGPTDNQIEQNMMDYVTKTMGNLMNMESVLKKLKRKNLLIRVIERNVKDDLETVNNFQIGGHLEMLGGWQRHEYEEKWVFKMDFGKVGEQTEEWVELWSQKFPETIKLTITVVKVDGSVQSTKVNLNYNLEKCTVCSKEFKSIYKLKTHMKLSHSVNYEYRCQICEESLENKDTFDQHRKYHVERKELFPCTRCNKHFLSVQKFTKHMYTHSVENLKLSCSTCDEVFDKISTWREHMLLRHEGKSYKLFNNRFRSNNDGNCHSRDVKNVYVCKVCGRTFSRYSNLQRHSEIHGSKNSLALYSCSMCGCTYNYISSLTRHIVQNHMSTT